MYRKEAEEELKCKKEEKGDKERSLPILM